MSLASIIVLLQAVLGLLSTPNLSPSAQMQANQMATQVISMATIALEQSATTTLGAIPAPSYSISLPTSTDNLQPIVINVNPPVVTDQNNTPTPQPVLGALPVVPTSTIVAYQCAEKGTWDHAMTTNNISGNSDPKAKCLPVYQNASGTRIYPTVQDISSIVY